MRAVRADQTEIDDSVPERKLADAARRTPPSTPAKRVCGALIQLEAYARRHGLEALAETIGQAADRAESLVPMDGEPCPLPGDRVR